MSAPPILYETKVKPEWIDEFGHMNMSNYVLVCDFATYGLWLHVNRDLSEEQQGSAAYAVVETHVNYFDEVRLDDRVHVTTQVLGADEKRFRLFHTMYHTTRNAVVATNEVMSLGFDLTERCLMKFQPPVLRRLEEIAAEHATLPMPENAGRSIGMGRRK